MYNFNPLPFGYVGILYTQITESVEKMVEHKTLNYFYALNECWLLGLTTVTSATDIQWLLTYFKKLLGTLLKKVHLIIYEVTYKNYEKLRFLTNHDSQSVWCAD